MMHLTPTNVCCNAARHQHTHNNLIALHGNTRALLRPCNAHKTHVAHSKPFSHTTQRLHRRGARIVVNSTSSDDKVPFGYTRKDVILIGVGLIALGYGMYYGLQATGMDAGMAGNYVQLVIFLGICVGWIGSYLFRVANKQMTYVQQLKDYEEAVMVKRMEELPAGEQERLLEEVETERVQREARRKAWEAAQDQSKQQ